MHFHFKIKTNQKYKHVRRHRKNRRIVYKKSEFFQPSDKRLCLPLPALHPTKSDGCRCVTSFSSTFHDSFTAPYDHVNPNYLYSNKDKFTAYTQNSNPLASSQVLLQFIDVFFFQSHFWVCRRSMWCIRCFAKPNILLVNQVQCLLLVTILWHLRFIEFDVR